MKEVRGNTVVCRIRDPSFLLPLAECGYSPGQVNQIERICRCPGGLTLITGETNSGKSTTLASLMAAIPPTERTMEVADPVEVLMPHVAHIQIEHYGEGAVEQRRRCRRAWFGRTRQSRARRDPRRGTAGVRPETGLQGRGLSTFTRRACGARSRLKTSG